MITFSLCEQCGSSVEPNLHGGGLPKRFCSERCRRSVADSRRWLRIKEPLRQKRQEYSRERYATGEDVRAFARKLMRGEQIKDRTSHHRGMAKLKEWMGNPRPAGTELSLVHFDTPGLYLGWHHTWKTDYLLSMSPLDYAWESHADNMARKSETAIALEHLRGGKR